MYLALDVSGPPVSRDVQERERQVPNYPNRTIGLHYPFAERISGELRAFNIADASNLLSTPERQEYGHLALVCVTAASIRTSRV